MPRTRLPWSSRPTSTQLDLSSRPLGDGLSAAVLLKLVVQQGTFGEALDNCFDIASVQRADESSDGFRKARAIGIHERHLVVLLSEAQSLCLRFEGGR